MMSNPNRTRTVIGGTALAAALVAALALSAGQAATPSELDGVNLGTTADEITASLTERGYRVTEVEREDGMLEAEAEKGGNEYEIHVDPATGMVQKVELDD